MLFASLDQLIPIINLSKEFENYFSDPSISGLDWGQQMYFYVHKIIGFILASFTVAALSGLTQGRKE